MQNRKREFERYQAITALCGRVPLSYPEWIFEQRYRKPRPSRQPRLSDQHLVRETA